MSVERPADDTHLAVDTPRARTADASRTVSSAAVERLAKFEDHRYVGDKRTQVVHDIDSCDAPEVIEELLAAETFGCFAPDTLPEARNRGYRLCRNCPGVRAAKAG